MSIARPDKRNDRDWCMQFFGTGLGVAFLGLGILHVLGRGGFMGYGYIGIGGAWVLMGLVHRSRWRKKKREFDRALKECFE